MIISSPTSAALSCRNHLLRRGLFVSGIVTVALNLAPPLWAADGGQATVQPLISGQDLPVTPPVTPPALAAPRVVDQGHVVKGEVLAEGFQTPGDSSHYDIYDAINLLRAGGEACAFGAATGVVSVMVTTAQAGNGLWAPSLFGITLGAAGFGCVLGFVGTTAATSFTYLWERGVDPNLPFLLGDQPGPPPTPYQQPTPTQPPATQDSPLVPDPQERGVRP